MFRFIWFFWGCLIVTQSFAQSKVKQLQHADIGIYLKHLIIDEESSTFRADAYYWLTVRRTDNRPLSYYRDTLSALEFVNALDIVDSAVVEYKWIKKFGNEEFFYKTGIVRGTFSFNADFRDYPKDEQEISFVIESPLLTSDQLQFYGEYDSTYKYMYAAYIDANISLPGRTVSNIEVATSMSEYNTDFGDKSVGKKEYAGYKASYFIQREYTSFLLKILIPNLLLLIISYLVFFIPARELEVAVGCTVTSLLASIALKWTIDSTIPNVGYTTNTDKMFYLFYFLITMALVQTVVTYNLQKSGNDWLERRLDVASRYIYPIILVLGLLSILY